jgi:hypothetical protein
MNDLAKKINIISFKNWKHFPGNCANNSKVVCINCEIYWNGFTIFSSRSAFSLVEKPGEIETILTDQLALWLVGLTPEQEDMSSIRGVTELGKLNESGRPRHPGSSISWSSLELSTSKNTTLIDIVHLLKPFLTRAYI